MESPITLITIILLCIVSILFVYLVIGKSHNTKQTNIPADADKFELKVVSNGDYLGPWIKFIYTNDGGRTWKDIRCYSEGTFALGELCEMSTLQHRLGDGNFDAEKSMFSSYEKIVAFEQEQMKRVRETNESWTRQRQARKEQEEQALLRANRKI